MEHGKVPKISHIDFKALTVVTPTPLTTPEKYKYVDTERGRRERMWTAAEGNCFYPSIAYLLTMQFPQLHNELTHVEVRRRMHEETVKYRLDNPSEVIEGVDECERDPFVNHQTTDVHANEYTMSRVALIYNINICVHSFCIPPRPMYVISPPKEGVRPNVLIEHCAY